MPLLASVPDTELYQFFEKQNNEFGPVWSISLPGFGRMIQIDTPENVEHVLKVNFWNYEKGPTFKGIMRDLAGNGVFLSDGAKWKFQRQLTIRIFNIKAFQEYTSDVFVTEGRKVINFLGKAADEGTVIDFQALMLHFTLDSFGAASFGKSFGCLEHIENKIPFAISMDNLIETCTRRLVDPLWKFREYITGVSRKVEYDSQLIRSHALEIIQARRRQGFHAEEKDFLQFLLEGVDDEGKPLCDELIVDNILTFTIAARDTTAHAITWMFYSIFRDGTDEKIAHSLVREVDEVLGESEPSYMIFKKQKFAEACFYEALRVFPSFPRNLRVCVNDDILPDGTKVHSGEWVAWSSYVMGRSELIWGPDAKLFKPSRWIDSEKPSQAKFNSFNAGPRVCPGQKFATIQALTITSMILRSFHVELEEPSKVPAYGTSLAFPMLGGLKVRVSRRL
ncbi:hypothetical protein BGZ98_009720 [Dissophora globulifera]|nr:hypothetical protein BGZ98_009720 [Dissophora globulifera]